MHTLYFKTMTAAILFSCLSLNVSGYSLTDEDKQSIEQGKKNAEGVDLSGLLQGRARNSADLDAKVKEAVEQSADIAGGAMTGKAQKEQAIAACQNQKQYLLVSRSMGQESLKDAMAEASGNSELHLIFQGIPDGMTVQEGVLDIQRMAREFDPVPSVGLNPLMFRRQNVKDVPHSILFSPGHWQGNKCVQSVIASMRGLTNYDYLLKQVENGRSGNLGKLGPTVAISEENFMDAIEEKIKTTDWDSMKKRAAETVWTDYPMENLPAARTDRIFQIDPTVVAIRDIVTPDGEIVARKGDRINQLEVMPFNQLLVILNPLREKEIEAATQIIAQGKADGLKVSVLATKIDRDHGWESYNKIVKTMGQHVFLLTQEVRQRFQIRSTLSVVTAEEGKFLIREVAL